MSFQNWHKEFDKFWPDHSNVSNIFTLIISFWAKYIFFGIKKYRGVIFHEAKEGYKIWRLIDLLFQNWQRIWQILTGALEILKNIHFNGLILSKVYIVWAKKVQRSYLYGIEEWCEIWRKTDFLLGKWHVEFGKFPPGHSKLSNVELWWDSFVQSRKYVSWRWRLIKKLKNNWLVILKLTWRTSEILTRALGSLKYLYFNWLLVTKVYIASATKVQRSYLSWHWWVMRIL